MSAVARARGSGRTRPAGHSRRAACAVVTDGPARGTVPARKGQRGGEVLLDHAACSGDLVRAVERATLGLGHGVPPVLQGFEGVKGFGHRGLVGLGLFNFSMRARGDVSGVSGFVSHNYLISKHSVFCLPAGLRRCCDVRRCCGVVNPNAALVSTCFLRKKSAFCGVAALEAPLPSISSSSLLYVSFLQHFFF